MYVPLQLAYEVERRLERRGSRLPLRGADFVAVLMDELASLELAEELVGVAPDIAAVDFIGDDLALGVYDERSALGETGIGDQDLEVARESLSRIGEHRIGYLRDALGVVVPGLVDEVGVAAYGIDFASCGLELSVDVLEVLKLRRADERKVRRIEEEYAPLPLDVSLGHSLEVVVLVSLHRKIGDFLVDERHVVLSFLVMHV